MFLSFTKQRLEPEAYSAYLNRLPSSIQVGWERVGKRIVGQASIDGFSFGVQANSPEEFICVVNEGILVAFDTPREYQEILLKYPKFVPSQEELELLKNGKSTKSQMKFHQDKKVDKLVLA